LKNSCFLAQHIVLAAHITPTSISPVYPAGGRPSSCRRFPCFRIRTISIVASSCFL
jgi:hypothetical protein